MPDLPYGGFAENFTVAGLDEDSVCLGDTFAIGDVQVQVTQPREPCKNISHRWQLPGLTSLVERTGRTGWYLRVLREGSLSPGCGIELLDRPAPDWPVTRASQVMRHRRRQPDEAAALAALPFLSKAWQRTLRGSTATTQIPLM
jgi:MOSC domain-containing protein YiiM